MALGLNRFADNMVDTVVGKMSTDGIRQVIHAGKDAEGFIQQVPYKAASYRNSVDRKNLGFANDVTGSSFVNRSKGFLGIRDESREAIAAKNRRTVSEIATDARGRRGAIQSARTDIQKNLDEVNTQINSGRLNQEQMTRARALQEQFQDQMSGLDRQNAGSYVREGIGYANRGLQYMTEGGARSVATKAAVGGAAWMGASVAGRGITGGGVTYNADGRRDVAGIPFV